MASAAVLQKQKGALRKAMRAALASLSPEDIQAQSRQITNTLLALPEFQNSASVSCFLSMPTGEVDTSAVVAAVLGSGKTLFVPKMTDKALGLMDFVQVFNPDDLHALPAGLWGIREPEREYMGRVRPTALSGSAAPLDLIVMPGLAFDRSLSRLGYGRGFYDRFLASYTAAGTRPAPKLVALALREQILEAGQVPAGVLDWKVDAIVGPDGVVVAAPSSAPSGGAAP